MRLIDADRLLTDGMKSKYYHLGNGDIAIPIIDIEHAPTVKPVAQCQGSKWISVKDRLPEKNGEYLVSLCPEKDLEDDHSVTSALYEKSRKVSQWTDTFEEYIDYSVTHWMPLPEPPKEVEGNA